MIFALETAVPRYRISTGREVRVSSVGAARAPEEDTLADRPRENLMNANRTLTQCAESAARKQTAQMRYSVNHQTRLP